MQAAVSYTHLPCGEGAGYAGGIMSAAVDGLRVALSLIHICPSGTEPKIKTYFTTLGKDLAEAQAQKDKLAEALKPILA